uniref:Outer membrane protein beta-barrel domain-containing protein n=1 Tax=Solibacter usitatus (strain Ellin6076) TaxID=234267 RepID=Q021N2_SOLUE
MKKRLVLLAVVLMFAMTAAAQDTPKMETFLGYTYVRATPATNAPRFSANGGGGQFVYNLNMYLGAVADLGAVHNGDLGGRQIDTTTANFLFGPRLSMRFRTMRPYFQVLFGGVYMASSTQVTALVDPSLPIVLPGVTPGAAITARVSAGQTAFAMTAGGGLDLRINKHVSFRPIGLDYYMTRLQNLRTLGDNTQNNLRYTAGFNFTFGAQ